MKTIYMIGIIALLSAMIVMPASATTVSISVDKDGWVVDGTPDVNGNVYEPRYLPVEYCPPACQNWGNTRSLIRFDLSSIPSGATIDSATVYLYSYASNVYGTGTYNIHMLTGAWDGSTVTWNTQPGYDLTPTDSKLISGGTWHDWDVTSDVQAFVGGGINYGWLIKLEPESDPNWPGIWCFSSEYPDSTLHPYLEVTYTEPAPPDSLEFGDAPDPTHPSLLASNGARHTPTDTEFLGLQSTGDGKDFEPNAKVTDLDLFDDGLLTLALTTGNPAQTVDFEVTNNISDDTLLVNILLDLNGDGDWDDTVGAQSEHVVQNQPITPLVGPAEGTFTSLPFSTVGATPGPTWMRVTLTRQSINAGWDGTMASAGYAEPFECGETEDWEVELQEIVPPTPFLISGEVDYDTGDPVPDPAVTVLNTNTSEPFDVNISGNAYQVTTDSTHVGAGDVLHFNASKDNVTEFNRTVISDDMNAGGFVQDITITQPVVPAPDLIVTAINAYHNNTGCPAWFNLSNEIDVTVKNNGTVDAGNASSVSMYIEDVFFGKLPVSPLDVGASATVTFENWMPVGEDCLQAPCEFAWSSRDYNFTGVADCDNDVDELDEANNETTVVDSACYNGYMADEPLENVAHGMLHGGVLFSTGDGSYGGLYSVGDSRDTNYDIVLPSGASVEDANLNIYYTWHYERETCPQMEVSITNATGTYILPLEKAYNDLKCTCPGAVWIFPWGNYVYDLTDYIPSGGAFTVSVKRTGGPSFCVAAPGVVLAYKDENAPLIEYWINEGADILLGGRRYSTSSNLAWWECISNATFQASTETLNVTNATLGVVAPWGDSVPDDILFFNGIELGRGVYEGYNSPYSITINSLTMEIGAGHAQVGINATSVTDLYLKGSDNLVSQADDGDNIMACNAFLVVEYETILADVTIKPETLNLNSKGVFTAFVTLPADSDVADINVNTVVCEGAPAQSGMVAAANNGTLIVKFDREDLRADLPTGDNVTMTVTGALTDGTPFKGSDTVEVIGK